MPELPEVQTTVNGINSTVIGHKIVDVWTSYESTHKMHRGSIKDAKFFKDFKNKIKNQKILSAERRAKNILINLSGGHTILIHMKMTGHLLYGKYEYKNKKWIPKDNALLADPFNGYLRLVFTLENGKHLAFSDMRKFAKVTLIETEKLNDSIHLSHLGPEPLEKSFKFEVFKEQLLKRPKGKVKQVLMDQTLISGIGNIYSDEILWRADVHPLSSPGKIPQKNLKLMFNATKETLKRGIDFGGDSMSDYRNIYGERGKFQDQHKAYQKNKTRCSKSGCKGILEKMTVAGRSAHFCPVHQKLFI
ncbi:MAG: DNA-formamidopyrimidine glycosylase [bacterium]|nr:DNA-formamidopyrimidine glycosylase [bacterium]